MQKLSLTCLLVAIMTLSMEASSQGNYPSEAECNEAFENFMLLINVSGNTRKQEERLNRLRKYTAKCYNFHRENDIIAKLQSKPHTFRNIAIGIATGTGLCLYTASRIAKTPMIDIVLDIALKLSKWI